MATTVLAEEVQRVQNELLKTEYEAKKANVIRRRGAERLNERMLFHGTGKHDPYILAGSGEGFMPEYIRENRFYGKGFYFAAQPQYAMMGRYPHKTRSLAGDCDWYQVLISSVICGNIRQFGEDIDPSLDRMTLPASDYDSVEGGPHRPSCQGRGDGHGASMIHVVYAGAQIYPEFILTLRRRKEDELPIEAPDLAG